MLLADRKAPGLLADADDTAKAILCLELLGEQVSDIYTAVKRFEGDVCFRTYDGERDSSFSANCNLLKALLYAGEPGQFTSQIRKASEFLAGLWFNDSIRDKWVGGLYPGFSF